ncbi:MAG: hypothetical protein ABFD50_15465 [Smithella sp.]
MTKLTMEQAVVISAYTGILSCPFDKMHEAIEKKLGRPVWTHELASDKVNEEIRKAFRADFLEMIPTE